MAGWHGDSALICLRKLGERSKGVAGQESALNPAAYNSRRLRGWRAEGLGCWLLAREPVGPESRAKLARAELNSTELDWAEPSQAGANDANESN